MKAIARGRFAESTVGPLAPRLEAILLKPPSARHMQRAVEVKALLGKVYLLLGCSLGFKSLSVSGLVGLE